MPFPHLGAFESTKIHGSGQDVLDTTGHIQHWRADLDLLHSAGICELRYAVPWHRIERQPNVFDWSWIDGPLKRIKARGMRPILDPLHHVSFPDWLTGGFLHPQFPELYARFLEQIARRYDWIDRYTVVNEPLPTSVLCGLTGQWYPHCKSELYFVAIAKNVARAICLGAAALLRCNRRASLYEIDACEHHRALDAKSQSWVLHANQRRFLFHDLVLGRINRHHPLLPYLRRHGFTDDDRRWFQDHATGIDVLGLDYYAHSEMEWRWNSETDSPTIDFPCKQPLGFCAVAQHYVERYRLPVFLSETNIGGSITDRLTWLKFMEAEAEKLAQLADFRGFCWFPSIDATDWDSLCTIANKRLSPMGIWSLDEDCQSRNRSELSQWYTRLARAECSSADLPAYPFDPPLHDHLAGYVRLMPHFTMRRPPAESERANEHAA